MRHDLIRDVIYFWAKKAEFTVEKEKYGLLLGGKKPADVYIYAFRKGSAYALDVTVASPFKAGKVLRSAAQYHLAAADVAASDKYKKYRQDIADQPWKYQPLCFEALGGFDEPARLCIGSIAKRACKKINVPQAVVVQSMTREISAILARGAARLALRRMIPREQCFIDC